jgi:hypothetical protein
VVSGPKWDRDIDGSGYATDEAQRIRPRQYVARGEERRALEIVAACESLWRVGHNLLDIYGLPRERGTLAALLSG